ncbi:hypothetical protein [Halobacillus sp. BBL2006]|uniref:hypothetical protein n=1 Tax=Halobacillus sp. BBL2006 TaxID=1543706 RepID=UPI00054413A4|nr:hypothetical protein [Halobacillus sp. BBL2006]KHE67479.1 hypothetical protein LD39_17330 [Halobacillus sp. BBL2006]
MTNRRYIFLALWAAFVLYAWQIAPTGDQGYLQQLMTMEDPDPLLLMLFSLLGIYPAVFAILILSHDKSRFPAWPFVVGSFMLGAFALLPYFFLSNTKNYRSNRTPAWLQKFLEFTSIHMLLLLGSLVLIFHGFLNGDFSLYWQAFETSQFVHVMTIDFFVLTGLSMYVIGWEQEKHGGKRYWSLIGMVPIIGVLLYIILTRKKRVV